MSGAGTGTVRLRALAALVLCAAAPLAAQTGGAISGTVRDSLRGTPVHGAEVIVVGAQRSALTDTAGGYRIREVRSGRYRVLARAIGCGPILHDNVVVPAGATVLLNFRLDCSAVEVRGLEVRTTPDIVLDPTVTATVQRITADDLRHLPVTTIEEAVALSAGAVGESYRGGRVGQQSFIIDGLGVKNQLDQSTGGLGVRVPPDVLTEAALVTNGFSARYGQAISGLINVVTKDGGERWDGRLAYENDRPFPGSWDMGLDRLVLEADGPLVGRVRFLGAVDATGRLDADPVNAPPPADTLDPRSRRPSLLPHNSGEQVDLTAKLTIAIGAHHTLRLFGLHSVDQRLLFEPLFKYDDRFAPARRLRGDLVSGHWQYAGVSGAGASLVTDLRVAYFDRDFIRGSLAEVPTRRFGGFTGRTFHFIGEDIARAQDTAAARAAIPGLDPPQLSDRTPWGVPAFFEGGGGRGELAWNHFRELRTQLDLDVGSGREVDFYLGGEVIRQRVETFQRALGYQPVGGKAAVPPATASSFTPVSAAAYGEMQLRWEDLAFTMGLRYDRFDSREESARATLEGLTVQPKQTVSPRLGVSSVLKGATVVVSWGRFSQAPDFQYLVDAAFDDTVRTGRFRAGNPALGFERSSQYEFSVRARPTPITSLRVNAYVKHLEGLVASVPFGLNPDSSIFGNTDYGNVQGGEIIFERELVGGWGARIAYTLQSATATATNAFQLFQRIRIAPGGQDTIRPARVEFPLDYDRRHGVTVILQGRVADSAGPRLLGLRAIGGWEAAAIVRWASGLPYSRTNPTGDTLLGLPNSWRLPDQSTVDLLVRRPISLLGLSGSVYFDARNLLNTRNIIAVRRDNGQPGIDGAAVDSAAAIAYRAHPEPIPYESPRYRSWADLNGDGSVSGPDELLPLYVAAARDYYQPLFAYGPPRVVRFGVEVIF